LKTQLTEPKTEEITVRIILMFQEKVHQEIQIIEELILKEQKLPLRREQNQQETIPKTEEVQKADQAHQELKTLSVLKLQEQARNQEAASHKEKTAQAQEVQAEEEVNIKFAFLNKKLKHNLTIVLFFIFFLIIDSNLF